MNQTLLAVLKRLTFMMIFASLLIPGFAQDDSLTFTDSGNGVLTVGGEELQAGSGTSGSLQDKLDNLSITVFSDLVSDPGRAVMRDVLEENLQTEFSNSADPDANILIANYPWYFLRIDGCSVLITMSERPREFTAQELGWLYSNPVIQEALDAHQAYVHIEMIQSPYSYDLRDSYRILGKVAASFTPVPEMMPEGKFIRGYVSFNLEDVAIFNSSVLIDQLLGDNPLEIFDQEIKIRQAGGSSPPPKPSNRPKTLPPGSILQSEAMKTSQQSFNTFRKEMRTRKMKWTYQVQALVYDRDTDRSEVLWINVMNISGPTIEGTPLDSPQVVSHVVRGQPFKLPQGNIINWLITDGVDAQYGVDPSLNIVPDDFLN